MQGSMRRGQQAGAAEQLSAAMDSEWDEGGGPSMPLSTADRQDWSLYHLVGDALRSDDLATSPAVAHDFAARFSARLASEPSYVAPAPRHAGASRVPAVRQPGWGEGLGQAARRVLGRRMMPSFAAAAAAATLAWVLVPSLHGGSAAQMANLAAPGDGTQLAAADHWQRVNLGSDHQLDPYLEAHQQFASDRGGLGYAYAALAPTGR
ncbi:sigma-E factor negative regulatory protein [Robbsia betulipollinis]|nr:sigma-E factor negative regulatory protein [Robbsia betulipollinis]